jgi:hypothetical protein
MSFSLYSSFYVSVLTQQISRPINAGQGGVAIKRLHVVLSVVMLRRTKAILNGSGIQLPERRVHSQAKARQGIQAMNY